MQKMPNCLFMFGNKHIGMQRGVSLKSLNENIKQKSHREHLSMDKKYLFTTHACSLRNYIS